MYYQPRVKKPHAYPLPTDYFDPVAITHERLQELRGESHAALQHAIKSRQQHNGDPESYFRDAKRWRLHTEYEGLRAYKRAHESFPTGSHSRIVGSVEGNYRDILSFFHSDSSERYLEVQKRLFHYTIDAKVLYNAPPSDLQPTSSASSFSSPDEESFVSSTASSYEGIKWVAYEPFALRFKTDSLHYEATGMVTDTNGVTMGYRILLPIQLPEVPDLFMAKRTVRMHAQSVMLLIPSSSSTNSTEIFVTMESDFRSNRVPPSLYKQYLMKLHRIAAIADQHRIATSTTLHETLWVGGSECKECSVCARSFSLMRSKHNCHVCGEVICRSCMMMARPSAAAPGLNRGRTKVCIRCLQLLREDQHRALSSPTNSGCEDSSSRASQRRPWKNFLASFNGSSKPKEPMTSACTPQDSVIGGCDKRGPSRASYQSTLASTLDLDALIPLSPVSSAASPRTDDVEEPTWWSESTGASRVLDSQDRAPPMAFRSTLTASMVGISRSLQEQEALLNHLIKCTSARSARLQADGQGSFVSVAELR